jgi:serine/threonine-protein kinase RsbT
VKVSSQRSDDGAATGITELAPMIRRVIAARVDDRQAVDDLVQETLVRLIAARPRLDTQVLAAYAVVVARSVVATRWRDADRQKRHAHRLLDLRPVDQPEDTLLQREDASAIATALAQLSPRERSGILAHELDDRDTGALAHEWGSTPGAVAAQLHRTRAKLRVDYLLAQAGGEPPTAQCRPVLLALSGGQRRRQQELDVAYHLLECESCAAMSEALIDRGDRDADRFAIRVESDTDVVEVRQQGRALAAQAGFSSTELTMIATALSEVTRNIVKFAGRGQVTVMLVEEDGRRGVTAIARDAGPGIVDIDRAVQDGYSTYGGMGLGLPGSRRLMDEFEITSEVGKGTTVVMTKWSTERGMMSVQDAPAKGEA